MSIDIALGALLHDIGKVIERTGEKVNLRPELYKYSHADFTARFFNQMGDRLGMIFSEGLTDNDYSIGRIFTLSRMMEGFFSGFLQNLLENKFTDIYTEYAGGDDLLLIGPWQSIMVLAQKLRENFKSYTCDNPDISQNSFRSCRHL